MNQMMPIIWTAVLSVAPTRSDHCVCCQLEPSVAPCQIMRFDSSMQI